MMKSHREIRLAIALIAALLCVRFGAVRAFGAVAGTAHDFSVAGGSMFAFDSFQVCIYCHTPHGANVSAMHNGSGAQSLDGAYLWNRSIPGQKFDVYASSSINYLSNATSPQPGPQSLLCLSCHDGIGAINVLLNPGTLTANFTGTTINQFGDVSGDPIISSLNIGGASGTGAGLDPAEGTGGADLRNDHPVGFVYNGSLSLADGELTSPFSDESVDAGKIVRLFTGRLECSSCHNPHDNTNGAFLVMDNAGSSLCLVCHIK